MARRSHDLLVDEHAVQRQLQRKSSGHERTPRFNITGTRRRVSSIRWPLPCAPPMGSAGKAAAFDR
jgi:hypothetical protein